MADSARDFKIAPFDSKTLIWWKNRRSKIDMDPSYQRRGRLWSETDKAYLIDSILNGYDIPKLYVADFTWGNSEVLNQQQLPYAIIDGKQRFEAIFDFFDGKITLNDDFVYIENPSLKLAGLGYPDLKKNHPDVAEEFDNYNLLVMSVIARTVDRINELFVRLNRSKPLTGAEIRNAMSGPAPQVIRALAKHELFTQNSRFDMSRGQDLNAAAKLLMFEYHRKLAETKKRNLDAFVSEIGKETKSHGNLELAGRRVVDTASVMAEIFLPNDRLLASAGIFPVYYWLVRNIKEADRHKLREFLNRFETQRLENRRLVDTDPTSNQIDRQLQEYDLLNRSTNDLQSHDGRYRILRGRFTQ